MADALLRLRGLKARMPDFSADIGALEGLRPDDVGSALNRIRFITEKALHKLCDRIGFSGGSRS